MGIFVLPSYVVLHATPLEFLIKILHPFGTSSEDLQPRSLIGAFLTVEMSVSHFASEVNLPMAFPIFLATSCLIDGGCLASSQGRPIPTIQVPMHHLNGGGVTMQYLWSAQDKSVIQLQFLKPRP